MLIAILVLSSVQCLLAAQFASNAHNIYAATSWGVSIVSAIIAVLAIMEMVL